MPGYAQPAQGVFYTSGKLRKELTEDEQATVVNLRKIGTPKSKIALAVGMGPTLLDERYGHLLARGEREAREEVSAVLFTTAFDAANAQQAVTARWMAQRLDPDTWATPAERANVELTKTRIALLEQQIAAKRMENARTLDEHTILNASSSSVPGGRKRVRFDLVEANPGAERAKAAREEVLPADPDPFDVPPVPQAFAASDDDDIYGDDDPPASVTPNSSTAMSADEDPDPLGIGTAPVMAAHERQALMSPSRVSAQPELATRASEGRERALKVQHQQARRAAYQISADDVADFASDLKDMLE